MSETLFLTIITLLPFFLIGLGIFIYLNTHSKCPFCKEYIDKKAIKCPHCQSDLKG